jgi:hypothetical protein
VVEDHEARDAAVEVRVQVVDLIGDGDAERQVAAVPFRRAREESEGEERYVRKEDARPTAAYDSSFRS